MALYFLEHTSKSLDGQKTLARFLKVHSYLWIDHAVFLLFVMLGLNWIEDMWVGPWTTQVMMKRIQAEQKKDEAAVRQFAKEFGAAHGINALLNLIVLISATLYQRLCFWKITTLKIFIFSFKALFY